MWTHAHVGRFGLCIATRNLQYNVWFTVINFDIFCNEDFNNEAENKVLLETRFVPSKTSFPLCEI